MNLLEHLAALSPKLDTLLWIAEDATRVALCFALAYLAYGIAHMLADLLADRSHWVIRSVRRICHVLINLLIYLIAGLYALEYLALKTTEMAPGA
jgi:hypothetical protein